MLNVFAAPIYLVSPYILIEPINRPFVGMPNSIELLEILSCKNYG
jgi:hypothetical protein